MNKHNRIFCSLVLMVLLLATVLSGCNVAKEPVVEGEFYLGNDGKDYTLTLSKSDAAFSLVVDDGKAATTTTGTYAQDTDNTVELNVTKDGTTVKEKIELDTVNNLFTIVASDGTKLENDYGTRTVTDISGIEITVTGKIKSVINLWPAASSSFFAMGARNLITGLAVNASITPWAEFFYSDLATIPTLGGIDPTAEALLALKPDLVIVHPSNAAEFQPIYMDAGLTAVNINFNNFESMKKAYTILGTLLGGVNKAKLAHWATEVDESLAYVRGLTADVTERPVLYYISGQSDASLTTTFGAKSIMKDWVESSGGIWASELIELNGIEANAEAVWALNNGHGPDIILCAGPFQHLVVEAVKTTDGWKDTNAVLNDRVYTDPYVFFNWDRFGLESLLQIKYALTVIHPELAGEVDMLKETQDFYLYYTGSALTEQQAQNMLNGLRPDGTAFTN